MCRITIRMTGPIEYEETYDISDADALPQFRRLKEVLGQGSKVKKTVKRSAKAEDGMEPLLTIDPAE